MTAAKSNISSHQVIMSDTSVTISEQAKSIVQRPSLKANIIRF